MRDEQAEIDTLRAELWSQAETAIRGLNAGLKYSRGSMLTKPLLGGAFGASGFRLATLPMTDLGLHSVMFLVQETSSGLFLSCGPTRDFAVGAARMLLSKHLAGQAHLATLLAKIGAELKAQEVIEQAAAPSTARPRVRRGISRRRRQLFEAAGGMCAYCSCALELEGNWHIDHRLPRAMGGGNEAENLAVACAPCNLSKCDKTDAEFIASMKGPAA